MKEILKKIIGPEHWRQLRRLIHFVFTFHFKRKAQKRARAYFEYDFQRFVHFSGAFSYTAHDRQLAQLIIYYHVIEKGLTMPNRRYGFGKEVVRKLMAKIQEYERTWGIDNEQVQHGIGVVKEYWRIHSNQEAELEADPQYWNQVSNFVSRYDSITVATQIHCTRDEFYAHDQGFRSFSEFAHARHTLRHYSDKPLPLERIKKSVELALTTPSACNRQYCRVHCISDKETMNKILAIQGGNRGFGHLADKLLIITADLEGVIAPRERNDVYTNGGMFLMNLCYALFDNEIAHCILNWSREPGEDREMRKLVNIKNSETIIAVITCGETPEEFDVAASPRKKLSEILVIH